MYHKLILNYGSYLHLKINYKLVEIGKQTNIRLEKLLLGDESLRSINTFKCQLVWSFSNTKIVKLFG